MSFLETMKGPEFLALYFGWFVLTWSAMLFVRHKFSDTMFTTLGGLLAFEALGAARYFIGSQHGMQKWDFLFLMMIVGALFFMARTQHSASGSDGGWGSSSSCGGGCGGGGCGGGGCGGCGS